MDDNIPKDDRSYVELLELQKIKQQGSQVDVKVEASENEAFKQGEINAQNNLKPKKRKRNSSIELLRIISMILIIAHHFAVHGGFGYKSEEILLNRFWIQFLAIGGKIGVNVFILITGYFLINSKKTKVIKLIKLVFQMLTYSYIGFALTLITKKEEYRGRLLVQHLLPISYGIWWFASCYVILYLLHPYLNVILNSISREKFKNLLLLVFTLWCFIPTISMYVWTFAPSLEILSYNKSSLFWFVYLYSLAAYIRKYPIGENKGIKYVAVSFALYLIKWIITVILDVTDNKSDSNNLFEMNNLLILAISLALFIGFTNFTIESSFINFVSATTFGIYLIHETGCIRTLLWKDIFKNKEYKHSKVLIPYSIFAIVTVFIGCSAIEVIRIYTIEKLTKKIMEFITKVLEKFLKYIRDITRDL